MHTSHDAALIVAMRNALPELLERMEKLERFVTDMRFAHAVVNHYNYSVEAFERLEGREAYRKSMWHALKQPGEL